MNIIIHGNCSLGTDFVPIFFDYKSVLKVKVNSGINYLIFDMQL